MSPSPAFRFDAFRAVLVAALTALGAAGVLSAFPRIEIDWFAQGAARLASGLLGTTVARAETGWLLAGTDRPVLVTAACSAADFFCMVVALLTWQGARRGQPWWRAVLTGFVSAAPIAIGVNALRIVAVAQAHRWIIPLFPENQHAALHLLTGVAVFLPALVALNLLLETHGRIPSPRPDNAV